MLLLLTHSEVTEKWDDIAPVIEASFPGGENTHHVLNRILNLIIRGELLCWSINGANNVLGFMITKVSFNPIYEINFISVLMLQEFEPFTRGTYEAIIEELKLLSFNQVIMTINNNKDQRTFVALGGEVGLTEFIWRK